MKEVVVGEEAEELAPADSAHVHITHEWGEEVVNDVATGGDPYTWVPDSVGVYKIVFFNSGDSVLSTVYCNAFTPVITKEEFIAAFPAWADVDDEEYANLERTVRQIIQNYTGQVFGPIVDKTLRIQGDGGDSLYLNLPIRTLETITDTYGAELNDLVEIAPQNPFFLQRASRFRGGYDYEVKRDVFWHTFQLFRVEHVFSIMGVFGYEYVPPEVTSAAGILLNDAIGGEDVVEMRKQGVFEAQLGDFKMRLNADQWGTTGNIQADNLLAPHIILGIGLV